MADEGTLPKTLHEVDSAARVRVHVIDGPDRGLIVEPETGETLVIGVAPDVALRLNDRKVSRYHLELRMTGDGIALSDLGSLNGTYVGGLRLERAIVPPGTRVRIGDSEIELSEGAPSALPASELEEAPSIPGLVGRSEAIRRVARLITKLGQSDVTVLVQGETGTGKEVVARAIHAASARAEEPFEVVDCGSMSATLIASELFGHEKGAFTGAERQRRGAFERAGEGTIFLDEIGELPLSVQPVLLGVLERKTFRRVGGSTDLPMEARVVSATHRDLRSAVNDGRTFRADLYYRLAVSQIKLPALRERPEDIEPLVRHFVRELTGSDGERVFGRAAIDSLRAQPWSGNVRELRNVVESTLAMGRLRLEGPSEEGAAAEPTGDIETYRDAKAAALAEFEHRFLTRLMALCDNNASEAARRARMDRPFLLSLLRKHDLR